MGRTIPSFRIAAMMEQSKWRSFCYNLDKNDRKIFDELFSISRLYNSACSNCARPLVIQCILMSIIFHHYKQLIGSSKDSYNTTKKRKYQTKLDELINLN
jgi:hypothetical protein